MPPRAYLPDLLHAAGCVRAGEALTVEGGVVTALGEPAPLEAMRAVLAER